MTNATPQAGEQPSTATSTRAAESRRALRSRLEALILVSFRGLVSRVRIAIYRALGMRVGARCRFEKIRARNLGLIEVGERNALTEGCWLWPTDLGQDSPAIRIGSGNYFNRDVMIDSCGRIEIGDQNMFGPRVYVADANHTFQAGTGPGNLPVAAGKVKIGSRCWIGAHAVILKDVDLGDDCVVGAGAVVTRSFPSKSLVAGVPARLIRQLD